MPWYGDLIIGLVCVGLGTVVGVLLATAGVIETPVPEGKDHWGRRFCADLSEAARKTSSRFNIFAFFLGSLGLLCIVSAPLTGRLSVTRR